MKAGSEYEVRLSGSGGQGLILSAAILARALMAEGRSIAQSQSYEPTSRGGLSRSDLVVGEGAPDYPLVTALDYLVILDQCAVSASDGMIRKGAKVVVDERHVGSPPEGDFEVTVLPIVRIATELGNKRAANIVALGAIAAMGGLCGYESLADAVRQGVPKAFLDLNMAALERGWALAA